jgi:lipoprotein NlpI
MVLAIMQSLDPLRSLCCITALLVSLTPLAASGEDPTAADLCRQAQQAFDQGDGPKANQLLERAEKLDVRSPLPKLVRGQILARENKHREAVAELDRAIGLDAQLAAAYNLRGSEHFKLGQIDASIADWDRYLKLEPAQEPGHWQRGIAYYYAGRYDEGARQFAAYQNVDHNDVENAVWRFICMARSDGVDKARQALLKIDHDPRVPMMEIYALFAGRAQPADVLRAAEAGDPTPQQLHERLFYAHLYLGLYYEVTGDAKQAREHIQLAAEKYSTPGYMGDVARVHWQLLQKRP